MKLQVTVRMLRCSKASRRDMKFHSMHVHPKTAVLRVRSVLRHPCTHRLHNRGSARQL